MRRIITFIMAIAVIATASAQVPFNGRTVKNKMVLTPQSEKNSKGFKHARFHKANPKALGNLITSRHLHPQWQEDCCQVSTSP